MRLKEIEAEIKKLDLKDRAACAVVSGEPR